MKFEKFLYVCAVCGGPRSTGSASRCRKCYRKSSGFWNKSVKKPLFNKAERAMRWVGWYFGMNRKPRKKAEKNKGGLLKP